MKRIASGLSVSVLHGFPNPEIETAWRGCLKRVELPAHYNAPEFFKESFWEGKRPFAVLASQGKDVVGVLTGIHEGRDAVCGLEFRPQACIAREADHAAVAAALGRGLLQESRGSRLASVYAWSRWEGLPELGFRVKCYEGCVMLDLTLGPKALFDGLEEHRNGRNVRKAIRSGVEVFQASTPEDTRAYYDVYLEWRRTSRKKILGAEVPFSVMAGAIALGNRKLFLARHEGKVIAGYILRFYPGGMVEGSGLSAIEDYLPLRPNDLLFWRAIEWACAEGFRAYCLGGSHRFLRKFGGHVAPVYGHRIDRTLLRRLDMLDRLREIGKDAVARLPEPAERVARRLLGSGKLSSASGDSGPN